VWHFGETSNQPLAGHALFARARRDGEGESVARRCYDEDEGIEYGADKERELLKKPSRDTNRIVWIMRSPS
jgi:hypothetical protein